MKYFSTKEYIEQNGLSADPESHIDQVIIGKHLRLLGYDSQLVREGTEVRRVWKKRRESKFIKNDKLEEELREIRNQCNQP